MRLRSRKEVEEYCKKSNLEYNPEDFDFRSESQVGCNESSDTDDPGDSVFEAHCIEVSIPGSFTECIESPQKTE
ncbi:hypothetical protein JTE90_004732 [Oedothorax gibbosus]|uniref:Uncharacterized protein n=1 Tax=Oedothorax gibbosus TaxID=931172 RepID=A0AAV6TWP4_9ARAC|nr:hypothetical protein JTE90_004732 [Oedothorax gibbosus]